MIAYEDFSKLELRIGKVLEATAHPDADKLLLVRVDIGEKVLKLVAGIRHSYAPEELIGKHLVVLTNLEPRMIRGQVSQGMLLAAHDGEVLSVLASDKAVAPGSIIR